MEAYLTHLLKLARTLAVHVGLHHDEREDCAVAFVEKMLQHAQSAEALQALCQTSPAYVRVCADNFVHNYHRSEVRRKHRACSWQCVAEPTSDAREPASATTALEVLLCQQELSRRLCCAVNELPLHQKSYVVRHYLLQEPIAHIAQSCGKSCHSVEQALFRARRRLHVSLENAGLSESELRSYLCSPPPFVPYTLMLSTLMIWAIEIYRKNVDRVREFLYIGGVNHSIRDDILQTFNCQCQLAAR